MMISGDVIGDDDDALTARLLPERWTKTLDAETKTYKEPTLEMTNTKATISVVRNIYGELSW
jgi:hypothetical protein